MPTDIKKQVLELIEATDNEELPQIIKADIEFFSDSTIDITDGLLITDKEELSRLATEPDTDNTMSEEEFIKATVRWRTS